VRIREPGVGCLLGASPSVFINSRENQISSMGSKTKLNGNATGFNFKLQLDKVRDNPM